MLSIEKQLLYLVSNVDVMKASQLIQIYSIRNISAQVIRNSLSSLKKSGYLSSPFRSAYSITPSGTAFLHTANSKDDYLLAGWDGNWQVVMLEIPESQRKKRDRVRNDLLGLGYGALYRSVYLSPWDKSAEVIRLIEEHDIARNVFILNGTFSFQNIDAELAYKMWPLDEINTHYKQQYRWLTQEFIPNTDKLLEDDSTDIIYVFASFLELGQVIAELSMNDPVLPVKLLKPDWAGSVCRKAMFDYITQIADAVGTKPEYMPFVKPYMTTKRK